MQLHPRGFSSIFRNPQSTNRRYNHPTPKCAFLAVIPRIAAVFLSLFTLASGGEVVFVRHGETVANASGRYTDKTVNQLTAKGIRQSQELVGKLKGDKFSAIVCSPAGRCLETVLPYLRSKRSTAAVWPELEEFSNRTLARTGGPATPALGSAIRVSKSYAAFFVIDVQRDSRHLHPYGRDAAHTQIRMAAERLRDLAKNPKARILVVGHSIHGSRLLEALTGLPLKGTLSIKNGAVTRVEVDKHGKARLIGLNG